MKNWTNGSVAASDRVSLGCGCGDVAVDSAVANRTGEPGRAGAGTLLAYGKTRHFLPVGQALGLYQTFTWGRTGRGRRPMAALDDRPAAGAGHRHRSEAWSTSSLAGRQRDWVIRMNCGRRGCSPGTAPTWTAEDTPASPAWRRARCARILDQEEVKPHKVRYYLEQRDPEFSEKIAKCCAYRKVKLLKKVAVASKRSRANAVATLLRRESRVSRRSRRRPPTCLPSRTFMRPRATTNTSVMGR